ncbi:MAG: hypothetical protein NTV88_01460, partial [Candidatus Micrarchaeota archaeon]|nr:hypothetical protein [Candidatus Micrarchaeota archaeon]
AIENKDPEMLKAIKDMRGLPSVLEDILKIALKHPAKMKGNRAFGNMLTVENVSNVNAVTEISKFLNNERVEHAVLVVAIGELGARGNKILLDKVNEYLNGISHIPKANEVRKAVEKAVIAAENYQDPDKKNRANERVSIVYTREI